jgi:D-alanyl-D-alanine carboxypeptidase
MKLRVAHLLFAVCLGCGATGTAPPSTPCLARAQVSSARDSSVAVASTAPSASAEPPPPTLPGTFDVAAIDAYLMRQVTTQGFVGLSVAIVKDGVVVLDKGYGRSRLSPDAPVQADTPFLIGSITKQFVAAMLLRLAGEKKLSLEDKVAKYFPDLTRAGDITLYDLMTHVSGYRDDYPLDFLDEEMKRPIAVDESINRYAQQPLDFEPRTRFSYSSTGYKILGRVIEKVTREPLGKVLEERVFSPLGMTHSSYMPRPDALGLARGYTSFALGPPEPAEPEADGWHFGASGIYAPAGDIAKWNLALMSGKVLGPEAFKTFVTPRHLSDGRPTSYACGIITGMKAGEETLQHSGGDSGFLAWSYLLPRTRSAVVVLSNRDDVPPWDLVTDLVALINKEHHAPLLKVSGPPAEDVARAVFEAVQSGRVDRDRFGADFNLFLTDARLLAASARLRPLGAPTDVQVEGTKERGGMEEAVVHFTFGAKKLQALMSRTVDGKVQQFLIYKP